ncbi:hypothetical protein C8R43DRAFT_974519 [Mycena crocata]|nr:hypothetical protein C8R43DRAFT_974519 [Mycena crocata]
MACELLLDFPCASMSRAETESQAALPCTVSQAVVSRPEPVFRPVSKTATSRPVSQISSPVSAQIDVEDGEIIEPPSPTMLANDSKKRVPVNEEKCVENCVAYEEYTLMTPEELDHAKDIVLDLLGWGVEPEYLVDCGVSDAVLHRIFTDLRLRLPRNLKVQP